MSEVLSSSQRAALELLARVVEPATYLAGGVAGALRLQHRTSRDLDLFTTASDPVSLTAALTDPAIRILTRAEGTLYLEVQTSPRASCATGIRCSARRSPCRGSPSRSRRSTIWSV